MSSFKYRVGGGISGGDPAYVERACDREAVECLLNREYVLMVEPRQQGKTSLLNRLIRHPELGRYAFAYVDLTTLDGRSEDAWYQSIAVRLRSQIGVSLTELSYGPPHTEHCSG